MEQLNLHDAMEQSKRDSGGKRIPYVAHRKNGKPWLLTVFAEDLLELGQAIYEAIQTGGK